jgi:hypothetical protein
MKTSAMHARIRSLGLALAGAAALSGCVVAPVGPRYQRPVVRTATPPPAPPAPVAAAPLYFYPQRGQPEAQQERDRYDCYRWAVHQTGSDPGMTPVRSDDTAYSAPRAALPPRADGADVVAGAVTGAAIGAIGSSPRNAGGNAVIGAIFGAAIGAAAGEARNRAIDDAERRQEAALERRRAVAAVPQDNFRRAMSACMQGRGYQVQ